MKSPRQYTDVRCKAEGAPGWFLLTYSKDRGFFEPIANRDAEPVIGRVTHWQYEEPVDPSPDNL